MRYKLNEIRNSELWGNKTEQSVCDKNNWTDSDSDTDEY